MRFLLITLIVHAPDPVTGTRPATSERFGEVIDSALLAEELGFDGFGVGERHERPFISSSPPLELFQAEIAPVLRREIPDPPWPWGPAGAAADPAGTPGDRANRVGADLTTTG